MDAFFDAIYFTKPILALIPLVLLVLQAVLGILRAPIGLTALSLIGHAVGISLLLLASGQNFIIYVSPFLT